jgi:hypothetical protein
MLSQALPVRGGDAGGDAIGRRTSRQVTDSIAEPSLASERLQKRRTQAEGNATAGSCAWPSRPGEQQFAWEPPRVVDTASARQQAQRDESNGQRREGFAGESSELGQQQPTMRTRLALRGEQQPSGIGEERGLGVAEAMGNAPDANRRPRVSAEEAGAGPDDIWRRRSGESGDDAMGISEDGNTRRHALQLRQGQAQHRGASGSVDGGKLNPRWVETLMGLPIGWTMPSCIRPVTIAPTSCDSSETALCQPAQSERSDFFLASCGKEPTK